jgi:hypothetical protein
MLLKLVVAAHYPRKPPNFSLSLPLLNAIIRQNPHFLPDSQVFVLPTYGCSNAFNQLD